MIFYKIIIKISDPPENLKENKLDERDERDYLILQNNWLLDWYEEQNICFVLQLAKVITYPELIAYLAYEPTAALKDGKINVEQDVLKAFNTFTPAIKIRNVSYQEMTARNYTKCLQQLVYTNRLRNILSKQFYLDSFLYQISGSGFDFVERIVDLPSIKNKKDAVLAMQKLLPSAELVDEIDRIFSRRNAHARWYGLPVHYKISAKANIIAENIIDLLVQCLYIKNRILSRRIITIDNITKRKPDETFDDLIKSSQNAVVQIMLNGDVATESEYASQYHQVTDVLADYIKLYSGNILFFFVENTSHPGFAMQLLSKIDQDLDIIEINEGAGNSQQAMAYFMELLAESNMQKFYDNDIVFDEHKFYSATEVRSTFSRWQKQRLKDRVYRAYNQDGLALCLKKDIKKKGAAFDELQSMVGLTEIKTIIKDIIAAYKVQKIRDKYYDSNDVDTKHMVFTGNPGTAKTTVARLLADILKENGICSSGAFIEAGRSDLVGKYVGWTAQIVKEKFKQAQGGILFIDEAYSLVEERAGLYGDEAINTIVQEMENRRGEVIVIFAGYPEKMKEFLAKNEGLRSRIAFHVNFPDYTPDELMGIFEKILRDKQYTITPEAKDKAMQIFRQVYTQEEYGNGRFVRNLFEQAVNRQASRISEMAGEEVDREKLFELQADDLDTNIVAQYEKKSNEIGFAI